jgi:hypothetical protein
VKLNQNLKRRREEKEEGEKLKKNGIVDAVV